MTSEDQHRGLPLGALPRRAPCALVALALLGGCSLFGGGDSAETAVSSVPEVEAERHGDRRFLVRYGPAQYFVDVRYINLINESVIAVRNRGNDEGRDLITVPATVALPQDEPFASSAQEPVALAIANHIRNTAKICNSGKQMALRRNDEGEAKITYRSSRGAWVIFAACPGEAT
ncbi:MAG: hypothetical protein AAF415_20430 [Pseudomonadota bacterium]